MAGPLAGIKVVDCSAYVAGPLATMILGDQGAEVVKIEPLEIGDVMRHFGTQRGGISTLFAGCNRSKRSLPLNLREEAGREILFKLVAEADVFVQNFRPGVVERMGIDETVLRKLRPDLIYVSISGFGQEGPWAKKPAVDYVVQGVSGFAWIQADRETGEPRFVLQTIADKVTALTASQAITAALFHRERTGVGQHVELSMLGSALQFLWPDAMAGESLLGDGIDQRPPMSDAYRFIQLKDGYVAIGAITPDQMQAVMRAIGRRELIEDERFATADALIGHLDEFEREIEAAAAELTVARCVADLEREGIPCGAVMSPAEIIVHPQVTTNGLVHEVDHPAMGRMRQATPPAHFSRSPAFPSRHAPALGENVDEILSELGLSATECSELRERGIVG